MYLLCISTHATQGMQRFHFPMEFFPWAVVIVTVYAGDKLKDFGFRNGDTAVLYEAINSMIWEYLL